MKLVSHKYIGRCTVWTRGLILKPALLRGDVPSYKDLGRKVLPQLTSQAPDFVTSSRNICNGDLEGNSTE